jgi:hypothetical protein
LRGEGPTSILRFDDVAWRRPVCLPADVPQADVDASPVRTAASAPNRTLAAQVEADTGPGGFQFVPGRQCLNGECFDGVLRVPAAHILIEPRSQGELGGMDGGGPGSGVTGAYM